MTIVNSTLILYKYFNLNLTLPNKNFYVKSKLKTYPAFVNFLLIRGGRRFNTTFTAQR